VTGKHGVARVSTTRWRVLAATLALVGTASLVMWADRSTPADDNESAASSVVSTPPAGSTPASPTPVRRQPRPLDLSIPTIAVASEVTRLGLVAGGEVEVPEDPMQAGWYRLGPPPGAHGTSVILGHVDSVDGPAVFARLSELKPGDRVRVGLDDGTSVTYAVHTVATYANEDFPAQRVYGGTGRRELNLVTCGGAYDAANGGYQSNVVVNARWVAGTRS
jgi:LPXTG-site transpeptidase (sortase) family protein